MVNPSHKQQTETLITFGITIRLSSLTYPSCISCKHTPVHLLATLTCSSGRRSTARLFPACCRLGRPCKRYSGSPGTGAWGWTGRWRASSSGCSSAGWSNSAVTAGGSDCPPHPAPASVHCGEWRVGEREGVREGGRDVRRRKMVKPGMCMCERKTCFISVDKSTVMRSLYQAGWLSWCARIRSHKSLTSLNEDRTKNVIALLIIILKAI